MDRASTSNGEHPHLCQATRRDGRSCTTRTLPGSRFCFAHDPDKAAARETGRRKGGQGKARIARVEKLVPGALRPVLTLLLATLNETHSGDLDPKVAGAMAAVAGAIVRVYQAGVGEDRLAEAEAQIAVVTRDRRPAKP